MYPRNLIALSVAVCLVWSLLVAAEEAGIPTEHPTEYPGEPATFMERSSHHVLVPPSLGGFWRKKLAWRPRWVKTWQTKKVYVAVWKRMWGPVEVKEWVPVPRPPPGWAPPAHGHVVLKQVPHH